MRSDSLRKVVRVSMLLVAGFWTACTTTQRELVRERPREVQIIMNATKLATAFEQNEAQAMELYGGKHGRIQGLFAKTEPLADGHIAMTFKTSIETFRPVRCIFDATASTALNKLNTDDDVSVTGTIGGFAESRYFVTVENCVVEVDKEQ